ncbi:hypothetical protein [Nonomuraea sp. CA-141351]|uniref:hypothetical protein n=1 Tax=Nonomuraea sp. CA-141351 TaxID=3239996 RepID=UPI003D8DE4A7
MNDRNPEMCRLYAEMNTLMDQICAGYGKDELELLTDFLHRTMEARRKATSELTDG